MSLSQEQANSIKNKFGEQFLTSLNNLTSRKELSPELATGLYNIQLDQLGKIVNSFVMEAPAPEVNTDE